MILEGRTNFSETQSECVFDALFEVSSLKSGSHTLEKCFPGKRILKGWFDIQKSSFGMGTVGQPLVASIKGVVPVRGLWLKGVVCQAWLKVSRSM